VGDKDVRAQTPAARGYRMPAEWEPHAATWIGWPHNRTDWPGKFAAIPWVYGEIVRTLVESRASEAQARRVLERAGVDLEAVQFLRLATNRGWTRDSGPAFVTGDGSTGVVRFRFNGWARYPDFRKDDRMPDFAARRGKLRIFRVRAAGRDVVLEGGAIDVNGRGTLITTEECLLDPAVQVRNPGLDRTGYENVFREFLGAERAIWLGRGIAGDDTHGHVDDLCRFVSASTVVLCREKNPKDLNYPALEENRERLEGARLSDGSRIDVVALPMPSPLIFAGRRLPASYANFYAANAAVLVPTFNDPKDSEALGILRELFRDRPVVGIHAVDLVWGLGTIHCLTRQEPAITAGSQLGSESPAASRATSSAK